MPLRYRLKSTIQAFSIEGGPDIAIPRGSLIEAAPLANSGSFLGIVWQERPYRVLQSELYQRAELLSPRESSGSV